MTAPARKPQDHLTAKKEALKEPIEVEFNGETYVIAPEDLDNIEVMEYFEDNKPMTAIKLILGPEQWQTFKDSNRDEKGRVTSSVFEEFVTKVFEPLN